MFDTPRLNFTLCVMCLLFCFSSVATAKEIVSSFEDPVGDDYGDGTLVYPQRSDFQRGDLDLKRLTVFRDDTGFWFEAEFVNPIRDPATTTLGVGMSHQSMASTAKKGFYAFNLDIYLDIDRISGSGNTFTLPGRRIRIDPAYAWEKAIILSPRPEVTRSDLIDAVMRQYPQRGVHETESSIDQSIFFPTNVRIRGKSVSFFVPRAFVGASDGNDWALSAFVTGAKPYSPLGLGLFGSSKQAPLEELELGVMQPALGRPELSFGSEASYAALPVVDALLPTAVQQKALLSSGGVLTGRSWGARAVDEKKLAAQFEAISRPSQAALKEPVDSSSVWSDPVSALRGLFAGTPEPAQSRPIPPVDSLLGPQRSNLAPSIAPQAAEKQNLAVRLRTLQQLYDQKLIDESEFKQQKQRLLGDL